MKFIVYARGHQTFCSEGRIAARITAAGRMQIAKKYTIIYNLHRHELNAITKSAVEEQSCDENRKVVVA